LADGGDGFAWVEQVVLVAVDVDEPAVVPRGFGTLLAVVAGAEVARMLFLMAWVRARLRAVSRLLVWVVSWVDAMRAWKLGMAIDSRMAEMAMVIMSSSRV